MEVLLVMWSFQIKLGSLRIYKQQQYENVGTYLLNLSRWMWIIYYIGQTGRTFKQR